MFKKSSKTSPIHITFLITPDFSLIAFAGIIEPLCSANRIAEKTVYTWEVISKEGNPETSSSGVEIIANNNMTSITRPDNLIVCSGINGHLYQDNGVFGNLRRWSVEGAYIGGVCTGAYILANAGLLNGYKCTIHWEYLDSFIEQFPNSIVRPDLFTIDRDRFTCSGGTTSIDMMLHEIKYRLGVDIASSVAEQFMHERIRKNEDNQRLPLQTRLRITHPKLIMVISEMEKNTETPLSREEIADLVNLSHRQLERLFKKYINTSPAKYYMTLRLGRAKVLLLQTTMPITEVAFASGFTSASHFSKCYRDLFEHPPREERRGIL